MSRTTDGKSGNAATSAVVGLMFIEYARAATLIVETVLAHRDYDTMFNVQQRANSTEVSECFVSFAWAKVLAITFFFVFVAGLWGFACFSLVA